MKKVLFFICVLASLTNRAQAPQKINYQAVARNASGTPIVNTPVTLTITISNSSTTFSEWQTVVSNSVGIMNLVIGNGNLITASTPLSAMNWSVNPTNISVIMDIGSGPVPIGTQQLVSVPYALFAANAGSSGPSYSGSSNVTISSSNVIDLSNTLGASAGPYGFNLSPNSTVPTFVVDPYGRLTSVGQYTANLTGDVSGVLSNQKVVGINGIPIAAGSPSVNQALVYNGTNWGPVTTPWLESSGSIIQTNIGENVGIGTNSPSNKLDIVTSGTFAANDQQILSLGSGNALQILKFANSGSGIFVSMGSGNTSTAVAIGHPGGGYGLTVDAASNNAIWSTSTGSVATISAQNKTGPGPSLRAFKTSAGLPGPVVTFDQSATGYTTEVLQVTTSSDGAAIRAVGDATVAGSKPVALQVENGHIRAVGPGVSVSTAAGTGITVSSSTTLGGSNDVKGVISINASGAGLVANSTLDMTLTFNRSYANPPRVVVTPLSNLQQFSYYISSTTTSQFTLRMYIPAGASLGPVASQLFEFNYMVIE